MKLRKAALCMLFLLASLAAAFAEPVQRRVTLKAVGGDTDATGFATIAMFPPGTRRGDQYVQVKVEKVAGNAVFTLIIDGAQVDTFTTTRGGTFEAIYEREPVGSHRLLPDFLQPVTNIKIIEVIDKDGQPVLRGDAAAIRREHIEQTFALTPTGVYPDADGQAEIEVQTENGTATRQTLEIEVEDLLPSTTFKVFLDGSELGGFTTDASGKATIVFSSDQRSGELPLPLFINLKDVTLIEIKDVSGQVVLTSASTPAGQTIALTSTGAISTAGGTAQLQTSADPALLLQVNGLTPRAVFVVKVDGKLAGSINTDSAGSGKLELAASTPSDCALPLPSSINPNLVKLVEVMNEAGQIVLSGMF